MALSDPFLYTAKILQQFVCGRDRLLYRKHASELKVAEAAFVAGLVKSPSTYAPTVSADRALARRNVVLQATGSAGVVDERAYQSGRAQPAKALNDTLRRGDAYGQYFKEEVLSTQKWPADTAPCADRRPRRTLNGELQP